VADSVESRDRGKLGHELKVRINEGASEQDLTHVGVGVSQVLPILVMCLIADRDNVLLFEQPELHLHPKVQTLLGDFFLSMALMDKQCIIETHSEYLINRLRFRAAAATADEVTKKMTIYFVEKKNNRSEFRPVVVNEFGAIPDWPDGFFDQSQDEAEQIIREATRKRLALEGRLPRAGRND
jgi:predicted ATPase